jgi:oligopeptidase A
VLDGLFKVVERLYQVRIQPDSGPVWHPDVRFFRIERDGELIGQFYLDLYARDTKKGGAWMDSAITRRRIPGGIETPVAYLVCNFPGPVGGKPATFSHDDVITLFHEAGHGLHHLLTGWTTWPSPASTASNGTPSSCPASSWKTSAGNGTWCAT